jgi:hypothetical protein
MTVAPVSLQLFVVGLLILAIVALATSPSPGNMAGLVLAGLVAWGLLAGVQLVWFILVAAAVVSIPIDVVLGSPWYGIVSSIVGLALLVWPATRQFIYRER